MSKPDSSDPYRGLPIITSPAPHLILPSPHEDFCLTPYFAFDAPEQYRLFQVPYLMYTLGIRNPESMDLAGAQAHVEKYGKTYGDTKGLWGFPVIRRVEDVRRHKDSNPIPIVGTFGFGREGYRPFQDMEKLKAEEHKLSDDEGHWQTGNVTLHPEYRGWGISTAVGEYILREWFIKRMNIRPGQLNGGWLLANKASAKLHLRLGFRPVGMVGRVEGFPEPVNAVFSVWEGVGPVPGKGIYDQEPTIGPLIEGWDEGFEELARECERNTRRFSCYHPGIYGASQ